MKNNCRRVKGKVLLKRGGWEEAVNFWGMGVEDGASCDRLLGNKLLVATIEFY